MVAVETSIRSSLNPNVVSDDDNDSDDGNLDEETRWMIDDTFYTHFYDLATLEGPSAYLGKTLLHQLIRFS